MYANPSCSNHKAKRERKKTKKQTDNRTETPQLEMSLRLTNIYEPPV